MTCCRAHGLMAPMERWIRSQPGEIGSRCNSYARPRLARPGRDGGWGHYGQTAGWRLTMPSAMSTVDGLLIVLHRLRLRSRKGLSCGASSAAKRRRWTAAQQTYLDGYGCASRDRAARVMDHRSLIALCLTSNAGRQSEWLGVPAPDWRCRCCRRSPNAPGTCGYSVGAGMQGLMAQTAPGFGPGQTPEVSIASPPKSRRANRTLLSQVLAHLSVLPSETELALRGPGVLHPLLKLLHALRTSSKLRDSQKQLPFRTLTTVYIHST